MSDSANVADNENHTFRNGGTATIDTNGNLTLTNMTPGDSVSFTIDVENNSNVAIKYRTVISCVQGDLFSSLVVTVNDDTFDGSTAVTGWSDVVAAGTAIAGISVKIELPASATEQDAYCSISYKIEAVQGNAQTENPDPNTYYIYTANDLMALSGGNFGGGENTTPFPQTTISFESDIDMDGLNYVTPYFHNIDTLNVQGNGHSIKNLRAPLMNWYGISAGENQENHDLVSTIQNLTIKNSTMNVSSNGQLGVGALLEQAQWCCIKVIGCKVENVEINAPFDTRAAALVGYVVGKADVANCTIDNCKVKANNSTAGIFAYAQDQGVWVGQTITNSTVSNSQFTTIDSDWRLGTLIGTVAGTATITGCTSTANTLTQTTADNVPVANPNHELFGRITGSGSLEIDGTVYTKAEKLLSTLNAGIINNTVTITKNYVVLDAWTPIKVATGSIYLPIGDTLAIDGGYTDENGDTQCHYIAGLTRSLIGSNAAKNISIKNLIIKDSTIGAVTTSDDYNCGAFVAYCGNAVQSFVMENCHADNVSVTGEAGSGGGTGGLVGKLYMHSNAVEGINAVTVSIKNCSVKNSTVSGPKSVGGIIGFCATNTNALDSYVIEGCTVENTTVSGGEYNASIVATVNNGGTLYVTNCNYTGLIAKRITTGTKIMLDNTTTVEADGVNIVAA